MFLAFVAKTAPVAVKAITLNKVAKIIISLGTFIAVAAPSIEDKLHNSQ